MKFTLESGALVNAVTARGPGEVRVRERVAERDAVRVADRVRVCDRVGERVRDGVRVWERVAVRVAVRVLKQRVVSPPVAVWRVSVPPPVRASARELVSASCP